MELCAWLWQFRHLLGDRFGYGLHAPSWSVSSLDFSPVSTGLSLFGPPPQGNGAQGMTAWRSSGDLSTPAIHDKAVAAGFAIADPSSRVSEPNAFAEPANEFPFLRRHRISWGRKRREPDRGDHKKYGSHGALRLLGAANLP
jgi:hypothetical protein